MKIFIPEAGHYEGAKLKVGHYYFVDDATSGTHAQNAAFHALVQEYFSTGLFSYPAKNAAMLKDCIKQTYGAGFDYYKARVNGLWINYKTEAEAKENATPYWGSGMAEQIILGHLKSWADYTKAERTKTIDGLISEMLQAGVNTQKFEEILRGMQSEK